MLVQWSRTDHMVSGMTAQDGMSVRFRKVDVLSTSIQFMLLVL